MNPFQAFADNMEIYTKELAEPLNGISGNYVTCATRNPNGSTNPSATFPATVGHFEISQVLIAGGFSPRLMAQAIIQKAVLPAGVIFRTGDQVMAAQSGGSPRSCEVQSFDDEFGEIRLMLWDVNQGA